MFSLLFVLLDASGNHYNELSCYENYLLYNTLVGDNDNDNDNDKDNGMIIIMIMITVIFRSPPASYELSYSWSNHYHFIADF